MGAKEKTNEPAYWKRRTIFSRILRTTHARLDTYAERNIYVRYVTVTPIYGKTVTCLGQFSVYCGEGAY